jgi:methylmalonyl-CoA/ethylmalonyl-CoA epimerase
LRLHHIGIAVEDMTAAIGLYHSALGGQLERRGRSETEDMEFALVSVGGSELELMHSADAGTTVGKFLAKWGPGVHHVAYEVADLDAEVARLRAAGCEIVGGVRTGVHGTRITFVHPKSMGGVLTELVERPGS